MYFYVGGMTGKTSEFVGMVYGRSIFCVFRRPGRKRRLGVEFKLF